MTVIMEMIVLNLSSLSCEFPCLPVGAEWSLPIGGWKDVLFWTVSLAHGSEHLQSFACQGHITASLGLGAFQMDNASFEVTITIADIQ